jgi:hypothetical protein
MSTETTATAVDLEINLAEARKAFRQALAAQNRAFDRLENSTEETVAINETIFRAHIEATNKAAARVSAIRCAIRIAAA